MHRARIIGVSVFLAILSVVVSLGLACYLAWVLAINSTHQRLEALAQIASHQADVTLREASTALKTLAALTLAPCTAEGIDQMRLIALNVHSVKSVGYVEEEVFVCSSWGTVGKHVAPWPEDFTTADGVRVSVNVEPRIAPSKPMMALQYAAFNVLVDPKQFLEVALDDNVKLAIAASSGHLVGASSAGLDKILALFHGGSHAGLADGYLYALVGRGDWIAVAAVSRDEIWSDLRRAEWLLLPFGAITAMLLLIMIWRGAKRQLSPLAELKRAVQQHEFVAHYQPIMDLYNEHCVGAEVLVRWQQPDGNLVSPLQFIPLAEHSGLILPITDQVIDEVMRDLGPALAADPRLHVSINLSAADVDSGRFMPVLHAAMGKSRVRPAQVWLEVTEGGLVDIERARHVLENARASGHCVAIDDFGTGYSSLKHLQELPLDVLKLDKAFIDRINSDGQPCPVTEQIMQMANRLGLEMVAEGVEQAHQIDSLKAHHVRFAQGWYFAKAMRASEFLRFYREHLPSPEPLALATSA